MTRCSACNVVLSSAEELRLHYGSEAHVINVGRRVEGLRPLSEQELRRAGRLSGGPSFEEGDKAAPLFSCTLCRKSFHSVQTLQAHVRSTAHLVRKQQHILDRDVDAASTLTTTSLGSAAMGLHRRHHAKQGGKEKEEGKQKGKLPKVSPRDREKDVDERRCLLCGFLLEDAAANVEHLRRAHEFLIPMSAYCKDIQGLLGYLARKINGLVCLVCNEKTKSFSSLGALRDHMREADHEKIILSPEYQEFYSCTLEDPSAGGAAPVLENAQDGQLVLVNGRKDDDEEDGGHRQRQKKKILFKREAGVPLPRPREAAEEMEKRRMILAAKHEENTLVKKEYHELAAAKEKQQAKTLKQSEGDFQRHQLKVNLRSNRLHPKGYDGEGKLN